MAVVRWMWFILLTRVIHCYDNLCITKKPNTNASQSSTHEKQEAFKVIDGDRSQNYGNCAHTKPDQPGPAWVKVDLGETYALSHVVIYYRTEDKWKPYRFRRYNLEVSKTLSSTRETCYTDTTPETKVPNDTQTIACKAEARYVIIETNYDAPNDSATGPILEICEVEVYGCDIGSYGDRCQPCSNCSKCDINTGVCDSCSSNCVHMKCDENCVQGCIQGYWGDTCQKDCPSECSMNKCNRNNGHCNSCINGYYGDRCEKSCHWYDKCSGKKCDKDNGFCTSGCEPGYYGQYYCQDSCGECSTGTCERITGNCEACNTGFYGTKCDLTCSKSCLNWECMKLSGNCNNGCISGFYGPFCTMPCSRNCAQNNCSQNGICTGGCKPNWIGDQCDIRCSSNCIDMKCDGNGNCVQGCIQGYWGDACQNNCPSKCSMNKCNRNNGHCNSCTGGYYGDRCEKGCHWYDKCSGKRCDKGSGFCTTGCEPGYYGQYYCENICGKCSIGTCERINGNCEACNTGFYGGKCNITCSKNCFNQECTKISGNCKNGCIGGFYGPFCTMSCSRNCAQNNCSQSGICTGGCKPNWTGDRCNRCDSNHYGSDCSRECSFNCKSQICHNANGYCTYGCKSGFYLETCEQKCSTSCPSTCNRYSGKCEGECPAGKYGNTCNKTCNENCKNGCSRINGLCDSGCIVGKFGDDCLRSCGSGCLSSCRQNNGSCQCKTGWQGETCDGCDLNHYGHDCSNKCSVNCKNDTCNNINGYCIYGCTSGFYLEKCEQRCSTTCLSSCKRHSGECEGECPVGKYGNYCNKTCSQTCKNGCNKNNGSCEFGCIVGKFEADCLRDCGGGCISGCHQSNGNCSCETGWQGQYCDECRPDYYGKECDRQCSSNCLNETCFSNNGSCIGGCKGDFTDEQCTIALAVSDSTSLPITVIGAGLGAGVSVMLIIIIVVIFLRRRKNSYSKSDAVLFRKKGTQSIENKMHTDIGNVALLIEDPEEEPQIENPEEAVYYNDLSVAKDIAISDLLNVITQREAKGKEGFLKEFKSLPYGERFDCEIAKTEENMPKNRFKTTFPYDHSRVILEASKGFTSDYINANYIENLEEKREFIACQGPLKNTLVDHWRMIWQEHVDYIIMLTNLTEGPKVKCHQYWPDEGKEVNINPFSVTLLEEKKYSHFVERRMTVHRKKVTGSRTVVQYHFTRWPDHGTPNPLNLIVFHRHFRHKIMPSHHPILVHCSAGIGRTGTFIAFDVLSRYGKDKGKVNVIEYVKAMRKDRMTMIQNVNQYVFLYHVLYEFFRRKTHYKKRDEFLSQYGDMNKAGNQKQITNEFNELISLKPRYVAQDFKSGKAFSELNFSKSVLPVEQYLVYLTSHVPGRQCYYNAVNVSSFTRSDEFLSAQFPVPGAAVDLVRLLIDQESAFLISLNPFSEVEELQSWVEEKVNPLKLSPYIITKGTQEVLSGEIRKTNITITTKKETREVKIFECLNWSSSDALPMETSVLTTLIKQFSLYRKSHLKGCVTVISKDGATCCGVFCAVYNAIEQLQQDEEVDIFTIVQQLQCRRPEMISTKEEYEFCFKAVSDFLNTESVYANT